MAEPILDAPRVVARVAIPLLDVWPSFDAALDVQAQRCVLAAAFARLISARSGYYNSSLNRTTVRWDRFEDNIQSVLKYRKRQKADTLMNIITNGNQVKVFF